MKILLLMPRLDVPFKNFGPPPDIRGPITPLRANWLRFSEGLIQYCNMVSYRLDIEEKPLWAFNQLDYANSKYDYIIVPHKEFHNFSAPNTKFLYLMQTPFPEYFSLDTKGWAGNLSYLNNLNENHVNITEREKLWNTLKGRIYNNESKFEQPKKEIDEENFILFLCQLPHDETIKHHSYVSVLDALTETINMCSMMNKRLIVKGHPANPESMLDLKRVTEKTRNRWVDDVSIHSCIKKSSHCVTVNSGSGLEVLLHGKPIYTFGHSEYDTVASKGSVTDFIINKSEIDIEIYKNFMYRYITELINPTVMRTYHTTLTRVLGS